MATERDNPYGAYNFLVQADGATLGSFVEVKGLDSENVPIEYREGSDATASMRKLPGHEKYSPVQLIRGITGNLDLWNWRKEVRDGGSTFPPFRTVTIKLLDETHNENSPAMTWTLTNAWPTKLTGPSLNAKGNDYAVEQVDLVHDRLDVS